MLTQRLTKTIGITLRTKPYPERSKAIPGQHDSMGGRSLSNPQNLDVSLKWTICNDCLYCHMSSKLCPTGSHVMIFLQCIYHILAFFCLNHSSLLADVPPAHERSDKSSWCAKEDAAAAVKPKRTQLEREWSLEQRGAPPLHCGTTGATKPRVKAGMRFYSTFLGFLLLMPRKRMNLDVVRWEDYLCRADWERYSLHPVHGRTF